MHRRPRRAAVVALGLLGLLGACDDATEPRPAACSGALGVSVSAGVQPTITWAPACGVSAVTVTTVTPAPGTGEVVMWGITTPDRAPFGPDVAYGRAPRGATVWAPPRALERGVAYRARVAYVVGGDAVAASGERTFIP